MEDCDVNPGTLANDMADELRADEAAPRGGALGYTRNEQEVKALL